MKAKDLYIGLSYLNTAGKKVVITELKNNSVIINSDEWVSRRGFKQSNKYLIHCINRGYYKLLTPKLNLLYEIY